MPISTLHPHWQPARHPGPVLVGYSGGMDSSVLLHLLAQDAQLRQQGLRAVHIHHGLHPQADAWADHCRQVCADWDIPLLVLPVQVERDSPLGLEGAARQARHAAFARVLAENEILALAHHADDQAETLLLRALRSAGVEGLAAMRPWRRYAHGWLWRPLLGLPRAWLADYARQHALRWVHDPDNVDPAFDRAYLRHRVMPLLRQRWPQAASHLARSAALCAEGADLLAAEDATALARARRAPQQLAIDALLALSAPRRARVLRRWIADLGLPPLPANGIAGIEHMLLPAPRDTRARFDWHGARIQRWRDLLHADWQRPSLPPQWQTEWNGRTPLRLPTGDTLQLTGADAFDTPLRVHARRGGERLRLPGRAHSHTLKHLLQAADLPPWQRDRLPLLSAADGTLLAAGDTLLAAPLAQWLDARGARLAWTHLA